MMKRKTHKYRTLNEKNMQIEQERAKWVKNNIKID